MSVYGPRESPMVMNSRCIFEEYHVYTVEKEIGILRHITSWCHIALHPMTFFILNDYMFYWWLGITWYLITFIWRTWSCVLLILWVPLCVKLWLLNIEFLVEDVWFVKMILMSWMLWTLWNVGWVDFYAGCSWRFGWCVRSTHILSP